MNFTLKAFLHYGIYAVVLFAFSCCAVNKKAFAQTKENNIENMASQKENISPASSTAKADSFFKYNQEADRAIAYFNAEEIQKAAEIFNRLEAAGYQDSRAFMYKARIFALQGDTLHALEYFDKAIVQMPDVADPHVYKGYLLTDLERYEEAAPLLQKAVDLKFENAEIFSRLGYAYSRITKNALAAFYFTKALSLDPSNIINYSHRGFSFVQIHEYEKAEADFMYFLQRKPDDSIALYNLARAQYGLKKYDDNIATLKKLISQYPQYLDAAFRLGIAYASKGDFDSAIIYFNKAILQEPNNGAYYYNRGIAKGRLHRNDFCVDFSKAMLLGYTEAEKMLNTYCK